MESRLRTETDDYLPEDFRLVSDRKSWRAVALAFALLLAGFVLLITGLVLWHTDPDSSPLALICLGSVVFLPGFYYSRIAFYAWRGYQGYSFDSIPAV
ncbi:hypothetical protein WJX72_012060 [[Myrmecia] bisecta]|uniref:Transmembrane protein 230 n=1 Tax=[Myrmecia] bisecta TaxID=41462 RepID=A0AAW1QB00_9CHLO